MLLLGTTLKLLRLETCHFDHVEMVSPVCSISYWYTAVPVHLSVPRQKPNFGYSEHFSLSLCFVQVVSFCQLLKLRLESIINDLIRSDRYVVHSWNNLFEIYSNMNLTHWIVFWENFLFTYFISYLRSLV